MSPGLKIACVEEVADHVGYLVRELLLSLRKQFGTGEYSRYQQMLADREP
jgi:hypothetical protein